MLTEKEQKVLNELIEKKKKPIKARKEVIEENNRDMIKHLRHQVYRRDMLLFGYLILIMVAFEKLKIIDSLFTSALMILATISIVIAAKKDYDLRKREKNEFIQRIKGEA